MDTSWLEPAAKAITYAAVLGGVGACSFRWLLLPRVRRGNRATMPAAVHPAGTVAVPAAVLAACERVAGTTLLVSAALALVGLAFRLLAHAIAAFGLADAWSWESLSTIGISSRWGGAWRLQLIAATALFASALWVRIRPRLGWPLAVLAVIAICFALPFTGHAEGRPLRVLLHGAHVVAAGVWAGTLVVLVAVGRSRSTRAAQAVLLRAFAPTAAAGVAVLLGSGAIAAWMYVGSLPNLWSTEYGTLLLRKLFFVLAALALGAANWRRIHRRASGEARRRLVLLEVALAVAAIAITAFLTETGHPL